MTVALEFQSVTKEYRSFWRRSSFVALNDFSLSVQPGEIFGFLGPNGAGKTTAIHIALGLMSPSNGQGNLLGQPFGHARTRRKVGFLAENVAFYHLPAEKLVRLYGRLNGVRDPQLSGATKSLLSALDLNDVARKPVSQFSRGMLQRVGLAQAMVNDPELLILDEPTSALDTAGRVTVREMLSRAKAAGKTIFLSSHLLSEIELLCDRIGILHHGRLMRTGTVPELLESREEFEIVASGMPAKSDGKLIHEQIHFRVGASSQREAIEKIWKQGGEVVSVTPVKRSLEEVFLEVTGEVTGEATGEVPGESSAAGEKAK